MSSIRGMVGRTVLIVAVCFALVASLAACADSDDTPPADTRSVRLGVPKEALSALAYIARDEGLFEAAGLDVELVEYSGNQAVVEALVGGEIDAALSADTQIVLAAMNGHPVRIIGSVGSDSNAFQVVARADAGITAPGDLRGKQLGTGKGTASHFFLHVFLVKQGIADADINLRFDSIEQDAAGLLSGELDAVSIREPFTSQLKEALGSNCVVFEDDGLYVKSMNLCVVPGANAPVPEVQRRLLEAFLAAEAAGVADTSGAVKERVAIALGMAPSDLHANVIAEGAVHLGQALVLSLEDQARWASESGVSEGTVLPNALELLDTRPLAAVAPERVSVIE